VDSRVVPVSGLVSVTFAWGMSAPPGSLTVPLRFAVVVANWAMVRRGTAANTANTTAMMLHKGSPLLFKPASRKKLQFD
jgi:hypothetical protein